MLPATRTPFRPRLEGLEDRLLLTIFGSDNRSLVGNTTSFPWAAVCRIVSTFPDGYQSQGSAGMVSSKHVLTAGHMVYNSSHGGWCRSISVAPGQNGSSTPFGTVYATNARTWTGWTQSRNFDYDMALVTLNSSVGSSTRWFGLQANGVSSGTTVNTAGYPGDKGGRNMYFASGSVAANWSEQFGYNGTMDSYPGQSGSPTWVYYSSTGSRNLVGVVSWENSSYNGSCKLTSGKYNSIVSWISQDGGSRSSARPIQVDASDSRSPGVSHTIGQDNRIGSFIFTTADEKAAAAGSQVSDNHATRRQDADDFGQRRAAGHGHRLERVFDEMDTHRSPRGHANAADELFASADDAVLSRGSLELDLAA